MVNLAEIWACSGNAWNQNPTTCNYPIESQSIASQFGQQDLTINGVRHADGIHDAPSFVPNSNQHFHGSGSIIIETSNLGELAVSAHVRYDPNTRYSHEPSGNHLNIDLYWYRRATDGTITHGSIPNYHSHPIHAIPSRTGRIKLIDVYNGNIEFSDHELNL